MLTLLPCLFLFLLSMSSSSTASSPWRTLPVSPPLIVSRGDNSIFPDQSFLAYSMAFQNGMRRHKMGKMVFLCDLQLINDGVPICRTGIDLQDSTTLPLGFQTSVERTSSTVEQSLDSSRLT